MFGSNRLLLKRSTGQQVPVCDGFHDVKQPVLTAEINADTRKSGRMSPPLSLYKSEDQM